MWVHKEVNIMFKIVGAFEKPDWRRKFEKQDIGGRLFALVIKKNHLEEVLGF